MTKDEAIERIKSKIIFTNAECCGSCPMVDGEYYECNLTRENIISFDNKFLRTETCKALFKED